MQGATGWEVCADRQSGTSQVIKGTGEDGDHLTPPSEELRETRSSQNFPEVLSGLSELSVLFSARSRGQAVTSE